jgi:3-methyladenine DNA glycosylase AlkC
MTAARTGSTTVAGVPPEVLSQLHAGTLATATLAEGLAIDFAILWRSVLPELPPEAAARLDAAGERGVVQRMKLAAELMLEFGGNDLALRLSVHPSDTVRGWACFAVGLDDNLKKLKDRLALIRPLADDSHFGVREWAWLAMRPHAVKHLSHFLDEMKRWAADPSANLRRFASESTRPRGVWSSHIKQLCNNPALGLPVLDRLKADPSAYVLDSVGNWLNDAGKTQPEWVRNTVARWRAESPGPGVEHIARRAGRNIGGV